MIYGAPQVVLYPIDLRKDLIQVPLPLGVLAHVGGAFRPDLPSEDRTKSIDPQSHAFMADIDPSLVQKVFNIAKRERKSDVHHHGELDDFG